MRVLLHRLSKWKETPDSSDRVFISVYMQKLHYQYGISVSIPIPIPEDWVSADTKYRSDTSV